ncbi:mitochondrial uncoupling protein 1 [Tanacetum coccineum]
MNWLNTLTTKILAGLTTGALAISVANPTDLVKVRLQAEGKLAPGVPRRYFGALNAYSTIEGVRALWTGLGPNVVRNAIINAAKLASYDQVKQVVAYPIVYYSVLMSSNFICLFLILLLTVLKIPGFTDNVLTHLLSGLGAGFVAVCVGSLVDVVKSRMMGDPSYKGAIDCFVKTLKNDNPIVSLCHGPSQVVVYALVVFYVNKDHSLSIKDLSQILKGWVLGMSSCFSPWRRQRSSVRASNQLEYNRLDSPRHDLLRSRLEIVARVDSQAKCLVPYSFVSQLLSYGVSQFGQKLLLPLSQNN